MRAIVTVCLLEHCCCAVLRLKFHKTFSESESAVTLMHSAAALQCINRLCGFSDRPEADNNFIPVAVELSGKIEAFAWAYMVSFVPKIRHNARNTLTSVVKIYRQHSDSKLLELVERAMSLSWKQKTKYVVLTSIAKEGLSDVIVRACPGTNSIETLKP